MPESGGGLMRPTSNSSWLRGFLPRTIVAQQGAERAWPWLSSGQTQLSPHKARLGCASLSRNGPEHRSPKHRSSGPKVAGDGIWRGIVTAPRHDASQALPDRPGDGIDKVAIVGDNG